ncbi:MAG: HAMP domain-containing histidine kinase [Thermomicrobiales bacterium]|nr:HAMP domain-containing histidine kinase [Thermomicrobiales bacterium]
MGTEGGRPAERLDRAACPIDAVPHCDARLPKPASLDLRPALVASAFAATLAAWALVVARDLTTAAWSVPNELASAVDGAVVACGLVSGGILLTLPSDVWSQRLRWVGLALLLIAAEPMLAAVVGDWATISFRAPALLASTLCATGLILIGLFPAHVPSFSDAQIAAAAITLTLVIALFGLTLRDAFPLPETSPSEGVAQIVQWRSELDWYRWAALAPFALSVVAVALAGAMRGLRAAAPWLVVGLLCWTGAQLHALHTPILPSHWFGPADMLRAGFVLSCLAGSIWTLRSVARRSAFDVERLGAIGLLKADYSAMVAHEFGAPLAALRNAAELLEQPTLPTAYRDTLTRVIRTEAGVLQDLVVDFRAAALTERADFAIQLTPVPVDALVAEAIAFADALDSGHPLVTNLGGGGTILADPLRIGQVLRNLLSNAVRYSPPGAPIELRTVPESNGIRFEVINSGDGIDDRDHARIFDKFVRGSATYTEDRAGLGLGLYVSRRIVRAHGADLTVRSAKGEGAVFMFTLRQHR